MKIESKIHWMSMTLFPSLLIFGLAFLILMTRMNLTREDKLPFGALVFVWLLVSLLISLGTFSIYTLKKLILDENNIVVKYVFLKKEHTYKYGNVIGYNQTENFDRGGKYENCSFKTSDNKTYMFSNREFRNYDQLTNLISQKCQIADVSFYSNAKLLLIFFLIFGSVSAAILYISIIV
jgi:hypothetical protein